MILSRKWKDNFNKDSRKNGIPAGNNKVIRGRRENTWLPYGLEESITRLWATEFVRKN